MHGTLKRPSRQKPNSILHVAPPSDPALLALGGLALLILVGSLSARGALRELDSKREDVNTFLQLLERYRQSQGSDAETYTKLVYMSAKIQSYLGALGVIEYKPPAAQYVLRNYQVVVNELAELKHWLPLDSTFSTVMPGQQSADLIRDTLVRYEGVVDELRFRVQDALRNPFSLLAEGVRWVLSLPVRLLAAFGVLSGAAASKVTGSRAISFASGIIALVSFVSAVVGLVAGWAPFIGILRHLFGH